MSKFALTGLHPISNAKVVREVFDRKRNFVKVIAITIIMKHLFSLLSTGILIMTVSLGVFAQQELNRASHAMSKYDSIKLSQLPQLILPDEASRRLIPPIVDNSLLPWFRPIFAQEAASCGQASSIGYAFTYEIDLLRNLPASDSSNQYPPLFAYNFINGGSPETGVSSYETYEILKHAGCPTVSQYQGMNYGGVTRWMDGYDLYYHAMHNRVSDVYSIKVNTAEGIQTLKNWLYDHGNGSSAGGLATFYSELDWGFHVFPPYVPEAGKVVTVNWGPGASHSLTIVGYNDSIRWDYNGDGIYTNNIDLNDDGLIDPRDWEIGGFIYANSYGSTWANQGFSYMMTKTLADTYGMGGIWSNTVIVIDVRENYEPQLTAKVNVTYGCRNKLRIMAGVASSVSANEPEYILHFPVFDFQGGCFPMQGESASETIEIGLDLNPLLNYIQSGQPAKYFLLIQENDPDSAFQGTINSFSIIDYTLGTSEINSTITPLPINNNTITSIGINATVSFNEVVITTSSIPEIELNSDFSTTLQAQGGTPPYRWHIADNYSKYDSTSSMEVVDSVKLELSSGYNGRARVLLPFAFPFYGSEYNEVYATTDGYLIFKDSEIPWPYFIEGRTYFIETPMIAAASCSPFMITHSTHGVWYEESDDYVTFRWSMHIFGSANNFNATIRLFSNGRIEINYGDECAFPWWIERYTGISNGDGENYYLLSNEANFSPQPDQLLIFIPNENHSGITVSKDGILSASCYQPLINSPIKLCVSDQNNIRDYKTFLLHTTGLQIEYEIVSGADNKIEFGEEAYMHLTLTNHFEVPLTVAELTLATSDPFFSIITSSAQIDTIQPGQVIQLNNVFCFQTSSGIPDQYQAVFTITASTQQGLWYRSIDVFGFSPVLKIKGTVFNDGNNGSPEPGETIQLNITLMNKGGSDVQNSVATISSGDPYVTFLTSSCSSGLIASLDTALLVFDIALAPNTPICHLININLNITGSNGFNSHFVIPILAGTAIENFEAADLTILGWQTGPDNPWFIEKGNAFEGNYCLRSAVLDTSQSSILKIDWNVLVKDSITFWVKTFTGAQNKLRFDIKGSIKQYWTYSLPWHRVAYYVNKGQTYFRWIFYKGTASSYSDDCAWIDYIVFPPLDGSISTEDLVSDHANLNIYPNPAYNYLTIQYTLFHSGPVSVKIYDNNGRCIFEDEEKVLTPGDYTLKPNLGSLRPGIYTVQLLTNKGTISRKMSKL